MRVEIPPADLAWFRSVLGTEAYLHEERNYKLALHQAISALLAPEQLADSRFPEVLSAILSEDDPDLSALGIGSAELDLLQTGGTRSCRAAIANLSGGRWGVAQFLWIPRAVEFGLGEDLREAFAKLVDDAVALPQRVDLFRDELYAIQEDLQQQGGFLPKWRLLRVSLSFVAAILGSYDRTRFTYYAYTPLRGAFDDFGIDWPSTGTAGSKYATVCDFVLSVKESLLDENLPVEDMIDAQSFLWMRWSMKGPPATEEMPAPEPQVPAMDPEILARDLAEAVLWPVDRARDLVQRAIRWRRLLFQGPPGTGKTFVAERLARLLTADEEERTELVQFHPSYAYEDFVEGIRPRVTGEAGLSYEVREGVFLTLVERAKEHPDNLFVLVVDEINRANLPRVLGELLYALEYRGPEHTFRLPYSGRETYVPDNIVLIATMNSADRSIALVDAAARRRFRHVEFRPDLDVLRTWLEENELGSLAELAVSSLRTLNERLLELLDADRLIGHTYLMRRDLGDVGLEAVWEEDIGPVLREHLYNQTSEIDALRSVFLATS
jgi:5-methylcytosine-specific restriction protein B